MWRILLTWKEIMQLLLNGFETLKEVPGIGSIVRYYIAQIYYLQGRNHELLAFALPLLDSANTNDLQRLRV